LDSIALGFKKVPGHVRVRVKSTVATGSKSHSKTGSRFG
jgi:hypothetical protein